MNYRKLRENVCRMNLEIVEAGLVLLTWGNASAVDRENGVLAIKPSGIDYRQLAPEHIVIVSLANGQPMGGDLRPSSDTPTHLELYRSFLEVAAIVHTHSQSATAFAQAGLPVPCFGTTQADHFCGDIPVTRPLTRKEVEQEYEANTGKVIVECFQTRNLDPSHVPGVLVNQHGPFAWGNGCRSAVENAMVLEACAQMALSSKRLNPALGSIPEFLLHKHFFRKHGAGAYYGQGNHVSSQPDGI